MPSLPVNRIAGGRRPLLVIGWAVGTALIMAAMAPTFALITDVRFSLGGLRTTAAAGLSAGEVFIHRPITNRILMDLLDPPQLGSVALQEWVTMAVAVAVVGLSTFYLMHRLTPYLGRVAAVAVAGALHLGLSWAPTLDVLQPEWCAVVLAVLGVAGALHPGEDTRRRVLGVGIVSGTWLSLAALMKYTTVVTAVIALGLVLVLDASRAVAAALSAAVIGPALFGLQILLQPREWMWFTELSALNPDVGGRWLYFWRALLNEPMLSPVLVMFAATVLTMIRISRGRRRLAWAVLPAAAVAAVIAIFIVQAAWYQYHLAVLPPFVAALWAFALVSTARRRGWVHPALVIPALGAAVGCAIMQDQSVAWRENHQPAAVWLLALTGGVALLWSAWGSWHAPPTAPRAAVPRPRGKGILWAGATVGAVVLTLGVTILPWAHVEYLSSDGAGWTRENRITYRDNKVSGAAEIRARIGADTPVLYLAGGPQVYFVDNPTPCRYPVPVILARSADLPLGGLRSFHENLACFDDPRARYIVITTSWINVDRVDPRIGPALERNFDCTVPVITVDALEVCPRR